MDLRAAERLWSDWAAGRHVREFSHPGAPPRAAVCVTTFLFHTHLLAPGSWALAALELNANWALAHGYRFVHFTAPEDRAPGGDYWRTFSKVRAALLLLERGESACTWVLYIDADAAVNSVRHRVPDAILASASGAADLYLSCHWPHADASGECHTCRCGLASSNCSASRLFAEQEGRGWCGVNSGVFAVRNTPSARRLIRWWSTAGEGSCPGGDGGDPLLYADQVCARQLKQRWPQRVDVLPGGVMNAPGWYHPELHWQPPHFGTRDKRHWAQRIVSADGSTRKLEDPDELRCFGSPLFVCHPYGLLQGHVGRARGDASFWPDRIAAVLRGQLERA